MPDVSVKPASMLGCVEALCMEAVEARDCGLFLDLAAARAAELSAVLRSVNEQLQSSHRISVSLGADCWTYRDPCREIWCYVDWKSS